EAPEEEMPVEVDAGEPPPAVGDQPTAMRPMVHEAPTVARTPIITEAASGPNRSRFVDARTATGTGVGAPPVERKTGALPAVDLGLDAIAGEADRDQSGVYDRKALRKIEELDRQIAQLKAELDRARQAADTAAKSSGR